MLSVWACISDGLVCSNHGRCVDNQCACFSGYGGNFCEQTFQAATSSSDNLALILVRTAHSACMHTHTHTHIASSACAYFTLQ